MIPEPSARVVVTGMGLLAPNGADLVAFWERIRDGCSAAEADQSDEFAELEGRVCCRVRGFDPLEHIDPKSARRMNRASQMAVVAAAAAVRDSGLELRGLDPYRVGLNQGTTLDGADWLFAQYDVLRERGPGRLNPFAIHASFVGAASGEVAIHLGIRGPCLGLSTGCASGADAIGLALRSLRQGEVDVMIAGGADAPIVYPVMAIFNRVGAMSRRNLFPTEACRPFDAGRDGIIMGEGAAFLVLELEQHALRRGARPRAVLAGYGRTCDAYHITAPHPDGESAAQAMKTALRDAGMEPMRIDYVNAHGTATELNDRIEARAIRSALGHWGDEVLVSSTKPITGHLMGAAGALEAVISVLAIEHQTAPPSLNLDRPDPECPRNAVGRASRPCRIDAVLSNSFGFGGKNASLVFARYEPGEAP